MSKLISNLEILLKPIAPRIGQVDTDPIARTSVQGYFLTVSNLADQPLRFTLSVTISPNSVEPQYREFTKPLPANLIDASLVPPPIPNPPPNLSDSNYVIADDVAGGNGFSFFVSRTVLSGGALKYTTKSFDLPAFHTISVQILPNVVNDPLRNANEMEIRGFVEIDSAIKVKKVQTGNLFYISERFRPAYKVLVTPEYRGTIIPNATSIQEIDQTAYSVPVAGGNPILEEAKRDISLFQPIQFDTKRFKKIEKINSIEDVNKEISKITSEIIKNNKELVEFEEQINETIRSIIKGDN